MNLWSKIKTIWELTRAEHGLMYGCGVLIGIIVEGGSSYEAAIFGFFTAFFIQAGTFALNDYCDLESDIANRRLDRPLVRGDITKVAALLVACVATALGIVFAVLLAVLLANYLLFILAFILAVLGILYDIKMKELFAVSNFYIAFTMAVPFIYGGLIASGRVCTALLILSCIALLAGFGREVMKDIADVKGDELRNVKSFARLYGVAKAKIVVIGSYLLAMVISVVPFFLVNTTYYFNLAYIVPVIVADVLFLHTCVGLRNVDADYDFMRKETLIAIAIGLVAFISGALCQF
ncbi:Digeranylgeranylglyceryl phosphate synthase [ANME-1 cluster archaeon GoMg2]|nr:Digeranylgeranylglyceryl phosphate synthase [ANME-1 cluster archaeon GoMg2]